MVVRLGALHKISWGAYIAMQQGEKQMSASTPRVESADTKN